MVTHTSGLQIVAQQQFRSLFAIEVTARRCLDNQLQLWLKGGMRRLWIRVAKHRRYRHIRRRVDDLKVNTKPVTFELHFALFVQSGPRVAS